MKIVRSVMARSCASLYIIILRIGRNHHLQRVYGNVMTSKLPAAVSAYLAADKAQDLDKLCQCFTNDAQVHDESRQYQGHDSIRSWKERTAAKDQYTVEPLEVAVTERT